MTRAGWIGAAVALVLLAVVPLHLNGYWLNLLYQTVLFVGLAYGFNIISGYAGYFSFGQIAFFGIGAYTTGLIVLDLHWNWTLGALTGGVLCGVLAVPIGAVMLRLRGPFFAIGMLGLAQTARVLASSSTALGSGSGMYLPPGSSLLPVYYWTVAVAAAAFGITWWIDHSAFGLRLQAIREDETIAATLGVATTRAKVTAFIISAVIQGLLGGGYAWFLTYIEPSSAFSGRVDLQSIVMAILGGLGTLWGPLVGAVLMTQVSEVLWANFPQAYLMIFGGLLVVLLIVMPRGIVPPWPRGYGSVPDVALLEVRNVSYAFGGVKALDGVSLAVNEGEIVSIIGPNGAGKTTLFNVISGLLRPPQGEVVFDGTPLGRMAPHRIARLGIGRTNQIVRPFGRLSVVDNVAVGALVHERSLRGARTAAREIVEFVGLGALADRNAATLTLTQRKRLEVARALALKPRLLLLDEVMAGLTPTEMDTMAEFILALPQRGIAAIAGIEHVMRLVMRISHRIVVLDYGQKIAEGTPAEIRADPRVIEAYLGAPLEVL